MYQAHELKRGRAWMGRLPHGADLLTSLTDFAVQNQVKLGWVHALGAVRRACLGYYDQETREYSFHTWEEPMEICSLVGNLSLKDGKPIAHVHVTLSTEDGSCIGGHLAAGTEIFACEFQMLEYTGGTLNRGFDVTTGLPLWQDEV